MKSLELNELIKDKEYYVYGPKSNTFEKGVYKGSMTGLNANSTYLQFRIKNDIKSYLDIDNLDKSYFILEINEANTKLIKIESMKYYMKN